MWVRRGVAAWERFQQGLIHFIQGTGALWPLRGLQFLRGDPWGRTGVVFGHLLFPDVGLLSCAHVAPPQKSSVELRTPLREQRMGRERYTIPRPIHKGLGLTRWRSD